MTQITKDSVYDAAPPNDFAAMLDAERHLTRSSVFDRFIAATNDHFWNPLDTRYVDYATPFDPSQTDIMPDWLAPALSTPSVKRRFESRPVERRRFKSETARWMASSILHGEQGALNLSASLCHVLRDPGAQEYAANQCREEARHVTAFAHYIRARWGTPLPPGPALTALLTEIVHAPEVFKKIVGMQMMVEGLAMGAFATIHQSWADPLARRLVLLVMTDEAFHHKFGKIWADRTIPKLSAQEHEIVEDWAAHCFQVLLFNLLAPQQMRPVYEAFDLDVGQVLQELQRSATPHDNPLRRSANLFRTLVKTLLQAGVITARTAPFYALYVDLDALRSEGEEMIGDAIAAEGVALLEEIAFRQAGNGKIVSD
jgi:hypothetical protein